jgi:hypothetical protein
VNARDLEIITPEPFDPQKDIGEPPAYFQGASIHEMKSIRFRCSYCGVPHSAAILPHSPQIAKFTCRQCNHVLEIETRPSVMDSIEEECELRKDIGRVTQHPKAFAMPSPRGKLRGL